MKVTRDVVLDLLPLYLAGEASADTRALVEAYLATDPELAARVRRGDFDLLGNVPNAVPPELEMRALRRTRARLAWQRWLLALGVGLAAVGLSVRITRQPGQATAVGLALGDHPVALAACLLAAAACWAGYLVLRRRFER